MEQSLNHHSSVYVRTSLKIETLRSASAVMVRNLIGKVIDDDFNVISVFGGLHTVRVSRFPNSQTYSCTLGLQYILMEPL